MAYRKPPGYRVGNLITGAQSYKRYNGALSMVAPYFPGAPVAFSKTYNFAATPANSSTLNLGGTLFTFTYGGSPGAGVIPLVGGGGTAAQAAAATKVAVDLQLSALWTVSVSGTGITFTYKPLAVNPTITPSSSPNSNMTLVTGVQSVFGAVLPARFGKNYGFISGS